MGFWFTYFSRDVRRGNPAERARFPSHSLLCRRFLSPAFTHCVGREDGLLWRNRYLVSSILDIHYTTLWDNVKEKVGREVEVWSYRGVYYYMYQSRDQRLWDGVCRVTFYSIPLAAAISNTVLTPYYKARSGATLPIRRLVSATQVQCRQHRCRRHW